MGGRTSGEKLSWLIVAENSFSQSHPCEVKETKSAVKSFRICRFKLKTFLKDRFFTLSVSSRLLDQQQYNVSWSMILDVSHAPKR